MIPYALFITFVLGTVFGIVGHAAFEEVMEHRARKARRKAKARKRAAESPWFDAETDKAMDEAVALVQKELGGEILSYEKKS